MTRHEGLTVYFAEDVDAMIDRAIGAERERCAQLAEQEAAKLSDVGLAHAFRTFADRLREQP